MTVPKIELMAFPEVAQIRKGMPKRKNDRGNWVVGKDLNKLFRIQFAPGAEDAKEQYKKLHPKEFKEFESGYAEKDGFLVERIRAMMPFPSISSSWQWSNEAHNGGRMVARADDNHFITLRDPLTGKYIVENGQPFTEFKHGQVITYTKNDKEYTLPIKTVGRLKLFLPELERFVSFTFKTTSYYDRVNLDSQLASIQALANMFSNGNVAGVPFYIYRREQEICWNKPDGSAMRVKKWLINVEADSEWVKAMTRKMSNFALGDSGSKNSFLLPSPNEDGIISSAEENIIEGTYNPEVPDDEDFAENVIDVVSETVDEVDRDFPSAKEKEETLKEVLDEVFIIFTKIRENKDSDKDGAYQIFENNGNRNPNQIKDVEVMKKIRTEIKEYQNQLNQKEN